MRWSPVFGLCCLVFLAFACVHSVDLTWAQEARAGNETGQEASDMLIDPDHRFPEVEGSNLEGRDFTLPQDFEGELNLVLIAFLREQQAEIDTWLPAARALEQSWERFRHYELPTLKKMNPVYRFFIDRGMRSGIPEKEARQATITLYLDKQVFRDALGLPDEDTIYALLVDREGHILWRAEGVRTDEKLEALESTLESALPASSATNRNKSTEEETSMADQQVSTQSDNKQIATLGGGCFWCLEAVFDELIGVEEVESGYSGGTVPDPSYEAVCSGRTGHAEVVQITFDPAVTSFEEILQVFFTIHDPTTLNRQGADVGTQYRSAIFYHSQEQKDVAERMIRELEEEGVWDDPIVTEVTPFETFYVAEDYHQEYYEQNPNQAYCRIVIEPKLDKFRKTYRSKLKEER